MSLDASFTKPAIDPILIFDHMPSRSESITPGFIRKTFRRRRITTTWRSLRSKGVEGWDGPKAKDDFFLLVVLADLVLRAESVGC